GWVPPESPVATRTIPASRVVVMFFIVLSFWKWLLLASFLNFGVAGTLLGWNPFLSLPGRGRGEKLVPSLGRKRRPRHVRGHGAVGHRPPGEFFGGGCGNQTSPAYPEIPPRLRSRGLCQPFSLPYLH